MPCECQQPCHSDAISVVAPAQRFFVEMYAICAYWVARGYPRRVGVASWRATDTLLTGWLCLVAGMEPVGSVDRSEDRNRIAGLAFAGTGPGISFSETRPATMPDSDREPFDANTGQHLEWSTAPEPETTCSATTKIHRDPNRVNHSTSAQVPILSTDLLARHTHLQRVASGLPVYRSGGGGC